MVSGPIIHIEDDRDDTEIFNEVLKDLNIPNKVISFTRPSDAYHFLDNSTEQPFIIISDVNLPGMSGLEFKNKLDGNEKLKKKSIPFVFYSTSAEKKYVNEAYVYLTVQGYFRKGQAYQEIRSQLKIIFEYWKICQHPNSQTGAIND
jgi:response regulator RpfG family c-di-GMP phosphodiesterase